MAKVKFLTDPNRISKSYAFDCPGCKMWHSCFVENPTPNAPVWGFNNDLEKPTFTPSVLVKWPKDGGKEEMVCHSYVTDGQIRFLNDCTHDLKGQTVDLPDME